MRIAACALSAVLLSGCSWFGGYGPSGGANYQNGHAASQGVYGYSQPRHKTNPCQVFSLSQPVPAGCDPASVTVAHGGGFPQQPNFSGGYTSAGYGSHAASAGAQGAAYTGKTKLRKPKLRGSLSLGFEKSNSGTLLDYAQVPTINPETAYNPAAFNEGSVTGSAASGSVTTTTFTAAVEEIRKPSISFDDVYSTPTRVAAGLEYILSPRATLFANGGYSHAQGENGPAVEIQATLLRIASVQAHDTAAAPFPAIGMPIVNTSFVPNVDIAAFDFNFNDMERYDLEAGGRYYFNPIVKDQSFRTLTPFVAASVGASHYNETKFETTQRQLFYQRAFESTASPRELVYYDVPQPTVNTQLYDAQWVPSGTVMAGMEWQLTPKAALALETGVRIEGARDYSNGNKGEKNIAVPLTLRGSFNF